MNMRAMIGIAALLALAPAAWAGTEMSVQIKAGQIRATPSYLGQVLATVNYGARVDVLQQRGDWMEVQAAGAPKGWMHSSALTKKKIVLASGSEDVQTRTSGEELALAGKGFNKEVEAEFKQQNPEVDFSWVNWMEKTRYSMEELTAFLRAGGVKSSTGGER
ncbi:MAG: SH3 domain-containing protein [Kiritimatiellae bacterium]|nr:SH3 domain-containing protein [Kiritimatiellia bacterium]